MLCARDTGVIITMAGAGSRFAQAGYTQPKYEIEVHGKSLFFWSLCSLRTFIDAGCPFTFVARSLAGVHTFIEAQCGSLGITLEAVHTVETITDGQATTAILAAPGWSDPDRPVAIYNIDTYVAPSALSLSSIRGDGWIPCFPGEGDKWSFAAADQDGRVSQVREKKRISPHATIGLYWFDSFTRFAQAYRKYYSNPVNLEARERYIAPLYNQIIQDGGTVYLHHVRNEDVQGLGTPEDVEAFARRTIPDPTGAAAAQ